MSESSDITSQIC